MDVVKYLTSEYLSVGEKGDIQSRDEGEQSSEGGELGL